MFMYRVNIGKLLLPKCCKYLCQIYHITGEMKEICDKNGLLLILILYAFNFLIVLFVTVKM